MILLCHSCRGVDLPTEGERSGRKRRQQMLWTVVCDPATDGSSFAPGAILGDDEVQQMCRYGNFTAGTVLLREGIRYVVTACYERANGHAQMVEEVLG